MSLEFLDPIAKALPEVKRPAQRPMLKIRLAWVFVALLLFFVMSHITPYGVLSPERYTSLQIKAGQGDQLAAEKLGMIDKVGNPEQVKARVQFLESVQAVLASKIGSIATLGIGPIVMASIILQLLVGAGFLTLEKERYQGIQKLFSILFSFFEASIYVFTGFIPIEPSGFSILPLFYLDFNALFVLFQIAMGSVALMYLDEVVSKYGFGSGIGLFIVGNVAQTIVYSAVHPVNGVLANFIMRAMAGNIDADIIAPLIFTVVVFMVVVYVEAMRVEIPLTLGRVRGVGGRYPLKFLYTSNIPVIFAAALFANIQLFASVLNGAGFALLGAFGRSGPVDTFLVSLNPFQVVLPFAYYLKPTYGYLGTFSAIDQIIHPSTVVLGIIPQNLFHIAFYSVAMLLMCVVFAIFWVETANMSSKSIAGQLQQVGFSVPGFRRDERVIERVLDRYIPMITILGGLAVGALAVGADVTGAVGSGTGILLSVGILYRLYEELAASQLAELHPALAKFIQ